MRPVRTASNGGGWGPSLFAPRACPEEMRVDAGMRGTVPGAGVKVAIFLMLASAMAAEAVGAAEPPPAFDVEGAILEAADRLLPATAALTAPPEVEHVKGAGMYSQGFRFDTYEVLRQPVSLDSLTRLQVFTRRGSTIDLVLSHDGTRITTMEALRPVVLAGGPFPHIPRLFEAVEGKPMEEYSAGMAALFRALPAASRYAATDDEPEMTLMEAAEAALKRGERPSEHPLVRIWQEGLDTGDPLPALPPGVGPFAGPRDGGGSTVPGPAGLMAAEGRGNVSDEPGAAAGEPAQELQGSLDGRAVAVIVGEIGDSTCRGMIRVCARAAASRPGLAVVAVLANAPEELTRWAGRTRLLAGVMPRLIADEDGRVRAAFQPPHLPYYYLFDRSHRLVHRSFWSGPGGLEQVLATHIQGEEHRK